MGNERVQKCEARVFNLSIWPVNAKFPLGYLSAKIGLPLCVSQNNGWNFLNKNIQSIGVGFSRNFSFNKCKYGSVDLRMVLCWIVKDYLSLFFSPNILYSAWKVWNRSFSWEFKFRFFAANSQTCLPGCTNDGFNWQKKKLQPDGC